MLETKKAEIESEVAPKVRELARKHGLNDNAVVEGIVQFVVLSVLIVFVPGILYVVSTGALTVPDAGVTPGLGPHANGSFYLAQQNTTINMVNGVSTVSVIPTVFAIVLIIGVLMLLAMRR